jgi:hypothetical protein
MVNVQEVCYFNGLQLLADENIWVERNEVTGDSGRLHDVEIHNLPSPRNVIKVIKSRKWDELSWWLEWDRREMRTTFGLIS